MKKLFKALDDPIRRQILEMLKEKDLTAGEIADAFHISKPSISYHLDLLKQADLVFANKKGQYVNYTLNTSVLDEVISWLMDLHQTPKPTTKKQSS
ncbi:MAG: autorepressor SdpR family transcription factor [Cyclobacteriaceae bacterium]